MKIKEVYIYCKYIYDHEDATLDKLNICQILKISSVNSKICFFEKELFNFHK